MITAFEMITLTIDNDQKLLEYAIYLASESNAEDRESRSQITRADVFRFWLIRDEHKFAAMYCREYGVNYAARLIRYASTSDWIAIGDHYADKACEWLRHDPDSNLKCNDPLAVSE
ncbi:hypothetical protein [Chroococcidiopsis sp.]|uniref:hypothetical protein n=1 Tax=Chroococcidiopsis sp. TaxID=3088168 RepID=UPI003F40BB2F